MRTPSSRHDACLRARERASLRADGELSLFESAALHAHVSGCSDCRAFAAGIDEVTRRIRSTPLVKPELSIGMPRRRRRSLVAAGPALAAAAVAAVAVMQATSPGSAPVPTANARSNATALRADYTDRRLSRLFLDGLAALPAPVLPRPPAGNAQSD